MSANRNPRVEVRDLGRNGYQVFVDGKAVAAVPTGPVTTHAGVVPKDIASIVTDIIANTLSASLPTGPVEVAIRATVIASVGHEGVTEVRILPDQDVINMDNVADENGNDRAVVEAAVKYLDENTWEPLHDLPANVVWEG